MTEFVIMVVGVAVGFAIGWRLRELHAQRVLGKLFEKMEKEQEAIDKDVMHIEVEKNGEMFYIYNAESKAFIVQVKTKDELFKYVADKFPNKNVMIKKEHFALFDTV